MPPAASTSTPSRSHTTDVPAPFGVQVQGPDDETNVIPVGRSSVTSIGACASDGPLFVTPIVKTTSVPAETGPTGCDLVIARSASASTKIVTSSWLLLRSGSVVDVPTSTVFVRLVPANTSAPIRPVTVMTLVVMVAGATGAARVGRSQTSSVGDVVHVQPGPDALTPVMPEGSASTTCRSSASDGPALPTVSV